MFGCCPYLCPLQSVSKDDIKDIINKHNQLRSDPQTTKTAKAMCKMVLIQFISNVLIFNSSNIMLSYFNLFLHTIDVSNNSFLKLFWMIWEFVVKSRLRCLAQWILTVVVGFVSNLKPARGVSLRSEVSVYKAQNKVNDSYYHRN